MMFEQVVAEMKAFRSEIVKLRKDLNSLKQSVDELTKVMKKYG